MQLNSNAKYALGGGILAEIVGISANHSFVAAQIPAHVESLAAGALAGWIFGVLREQVSASQSFIVDAEALALKLELQGDPLDMLTRCPRHGQALTSLIRKSAGQYRLIAQVSKLEYLDLLKEAINHSELYQGVQRKPINWFLGNDAESYLETLRDSRIDKKTRLFVIDPNDVKAMEEDLASDVLETFWITSAELRTSFPRIHTPRDCAIYDRQLLIEYDSIQKLLSFDVLPDSAGHQRTEVFRQLALQVQQVHPIGPFRRISCPTNSH
jgi:hypothetical protein